MQHSQGGVVELILGGLKQLVARQAVEDVEQGLAIMAGGPKAGAFNAVLDLAAQTRDLSWRSGVGR